MRGCLLLLSLLLPLAGRAEIIDRVAATAGKRLITQSDIRREILLSSFLNQFKPDFSAASRKKTAERLVERALIENEMELGKYAAAQPSEIEPQMAALRKERFPTEASLRNALAAYGIGEEDLKQYLLQQVAVVRFIDVRFGPAVQVLEADLRDYYAERFLKEWAARNAGPAPSLEDVREDIGDVLRAERANDLMAEWIKETTARTRIEYKPEALQ